MRRVLQPQKDKNVELTANSGQKISIDVAATGLFAGKWLKVDVPRFIGTEAKDWVFKIKEFFDVYGVPDEQRIWIASFHMEGPAYAWYK